MSEQNQNPELELEIDRESETGKKLVVLSIEMVGKTEIIADFNRELIGLQHEIRRKQARQHVQTAELGVMSSDFWAMVYAEHSEWFSKMTQSGYQVIMDRVRDEGGNTVSIKFRAVNPNDGVLRFLQNTFRFQMPDEQDGHQS